MSGGSIVWLLAAMGVFVAGNSVLRTYAASGYLPTRSRLPSTTHAPLLN